MWVHHSIPNCLATSTVEEVVVTLVVVTASFRTPVTVKKPVESPEEFMALMNAGMKNRTTGATKMNDRSSRSHLVMVIDVEQHSM